MRGNRRAIAARTPGHGSIPAYAGEPGWSASLPVQMRLSPRMRGNRRAIAARTPGHGSIPAYAGEPGWSASLPVQMRLSPRMRGNPAICAHCWRRGGSIPAYAGEPDRAVARIPDLEVYPRVCGGTPSPPAEAHPVQGLSPRMRGNRDHHNGQPANDGSIPAYAGEPYLHYKIPYKGCVYPRVCGGTAQYRTASAAWSGLSPRMRGNRRPLCWQSGRWRSIPAYAGEPNRAKAA